MVNLKRRLPIACSILVWLTLLPSNAEAVTAGVVEKGRANIYISAGAFTHDVRIEVKMISQPPEEAAGTLAFNVDSCRAADQCTSLFFVKDLDDTAFTISNDGGSAKLRTTFGGLPLGIEWQMTSGESGLWSDVGVPGIRVGQGHLGDVHVKLFGIHCSSRGELQRVVEVNNNALAFKAGLADPGRIPLKGFRNGRPSCSPTPPRLSQVNPPITRVKRVLYDVPGGVSGIHGVQSSDDRVGGISMSTSDSERYVSVVIEDASGEPVYAYIAQDLNGDQQFDEYRAICGGTDAPIRIQQGAPLVIEIHAGPCLYPVMKPARATWGVIKVTLSNSLSGGVK